MLFNKGYHIELAERKSEVLRQVLENVPDLLVIDLLTAGEEGYELCQSLRRLPRTSDLPVVFVGVRAEALEMVKALRCGGNEYIQQPAADEEECWLRIKRHLKTAKLVKTLQADKASLHQQIWSYNHILRQQEQRQESLTEENQVLQRMAFIDGLTQVGNRRRFNQQLPKLWQQAYEQEQPISLLLCDIDYFKRYNDNYGHPAGDVCLQAVAAALVRGAHRHSDQVARYGGEEFAILLPATDLKGAQHVALSVQSELARAQVPHKTSLVKPYVSLSIGICTLVPEGLEQPQEILVHGADEALYTAKLRGRDRAVSNSPDGLISMVPTRCTYDDSEDTDRHTPMKMVINQVASTLTLSPATNAGQGSEANAESQQLPVTDPAAISTAFGDEANYNDTLERLATGGFSDEAITAALQTSDAFENTPLSSPHTKVSDLATLATFEPFSLTAISAKNTRSNHS
ncbi:MAG: diguanylate cyclase [Cyanobacteria bacterium J06598_1]